MGGQNGRAEWAGRMDKRIDRDQTKLTNGETKQAEQPNEWTNGRTGGTDGDRTNGRTGGRADGRRDEPNRRKDETAKTGEAAG